MKALIFDTETTDLLERTHLINLNKQPHITEFYGCTVDLASGDLINEYDTLIKVPVELKEKIIKITGITNDMLADQQPFSFHAPLIKAFIENPDVEVAIAHNLSFDLEMLQVEFERLGMDVKWPKRKICTVESTIFFKGFRLTLQSLHEYLFGTKFAEAHRAKHDVEALTRCSVELYRRGELV